MGTQENESYSAADCAETGYTMPLKNKVIVVRSDALPSDHPGQLFFCTGEGVTNPHIIDKTVFTASLSDGEFYRWGRNDVIGALKPELLPDEARLALSQIRPGGNTEVKNAAYSGYCFLPDGRYTSGVWLESPQEAVAFLKMQVPYQHRILLCDSDDFAVMEMTDGKLLYPAQEEYEAFRAGTEPEQTGGMTMT